MDFTDVYLCFYGSVIVGIWGLYIYVAYKNLFIDSNDSNNINDEDTIYNDILEDTLPFKVH